MTIKSEGLGNTGPFYTREEVYKSSIDYFGSDNDMAANIWVDKYCLKDNLSRYLEINPDDMHKRLAKELARIEQKYPNPLSYEEIYELLKEFRYIIPGGSILYGLGNNYSISSLGNCFVIGNSSDSYGGICQIDEEQTQLQKRRSGVGHDISHLRPKHTYVSNAAGSSTGSTSFMHRFSNSTREVAQDGRRGALMLTMNINHPDIEQFITSKDDLSKITGANISVKITDEFMKAVENDEDYCLKFPDFILKKEIWENIKEEMEYDKIYPFAPGQIIKIKAKEFWNKLIHQAWKSAEPGCLFWSTIQRESIPSCYGENWTERSTNP